MHKLRAAVFETDEVDVRLLADQSGEIGHVLRQAVHGDFIGLESIDLKAQPDGVMRQCHLLHSEPQTNATRESRHFSCLPTMPEITLSILARSFTAKPAGSPN